MHKWLSNSELSLLCLLLIMVHRVGVAGRERGEEGNHFQKLLYSLTNRTGAANKAEWEAALWITKACKASSPLKWHAETKVSNCSMKDRDSLASCPKGTSHSPGLWLTAGENSLKMKVMPPAHSSAALVSLTSNDGSSPSLLNVVMVTVKI